MLNGNVYVAVVLLRYLRLLLLCILTVLLFVTTAGLERPSQPSPRYHTLSVAKPERTGADNAPVGPEEVINYQLDQPFHHGMSFLLLSFIYSALSVFGCFWLTLYLICRCSLKLCALLARFLFCFVLLLCAQRHFLTHTSYLHTYTRTDKQRPAAESAAARGSARQ